MRYSISDTAQWGDFVSGPRVVDEKVKESMKEVLKDIQNGTFAKEWIVENQVNRPRFNAINASENEHQIESGRQKSSRNDAVCQAGQEKGSGGSRCEKLTFLIRHSVTVNSRRALI